MSKIVLQGNEAREKLKKGMNTLAEAVAITIGPFGKNAIIGREGFSPIITNDGVSIARSIELDDPIENEGAKIIKDVAIKADANSGDGTTTSIVLAQAMINEDIPEGANLNKIKKDMQQACDDICDELDKMKVDITEDDYEKVATISAESEEIGKVIGDTFKEVGADGIVTVEASVNEGIERDYIDGMQVPFGYVSPLMVNNDKQQVVFKNVPVVVTDSIISTEKDILSIMETINSIGRDEVNKAGTTEGIIFSPNVHGDALKLALVNKMKNIMNVTCVNIDDINTLQDISMFTGSTMFNLALEEKPDVNKFGVCGEIKADEEKTVLVSPPKGLEERVKNIKDEARKEKIMEKGAVLKVGGATDVERSYTMLKVEDAIHATKAAAKNGVVPGGGYALLVTGEVATNQIVTEACKAPYCRIKDNAGEDFSLYEVYPDHVIDPVDVVKNSLQKAVSMASTFLTTDVVIVDKPTLDNTERLV